MVALDTQEKSDQHKNYRMNYLKKTITTTILFLFVALGAFSQKLDYYFYTALNEKAKNNYAEAFDYLQHCYALDSTNANVMVELAAFYSSLGELEKSLDLVAKALEYDSDNYYYNMIAASLNKQFGNNNEVIDIYNSLLKKYPAKVDLYIELADTYSDEGELEKAIQSLDSLQKYSGDNPAISINKFRLYNMMNQKEKAFDELLTIVNKNPDNIRYKLLIGDLYLQDNEYEKARGFYDQARLIDEEDPTLILSMINYYDKTGKKDKSSAEIEGAMSNPKMDVDAKLQLLGKYVSILNQNKQDTERANPLFEQLFEQHPNNSEISLLYGEVLLLQNKKDLALEQFERFKNENKNEPTGYSKILEVLLSDGTTEKSTLNKVIELTNEGMANIPQSPEFYYYNAMSYLLQENNAEGMAVLKNGLQNAVFQNPAIESDFYGQIGDIYHMQNDDKSSFEYYEKALKINPHNVHVLNNYSYYLSLQRRDLDKAEKMSALTIKAEPTNATFLDTYAWILFEQEAYVMAKIYIEKAIEYGEGETSAEVYEHYGDILFMSDMPEEAVEQWKKAQEMGSKSKLLKKKIKRKKYYKK